MPKYKPSDVRQKRYEEQTCNLKLIPGLPIIARLDGMGFHTVTKRCLRPFDMGLRIAMGKTMKALVAHHQACVGYTQSDEITLVFKERGHDQSQINWDGVVFKWISDLCQTASYAFMQAVKEDPELAQRLRIPAMGVKFDTRVFNLPSRQAVVENLQWREDDCARNSLQMTARAHFTHKELCSKKSAQIHDMLYSVGVNWNDEPASCKRGVWTARQTVTHNTPDGKPFTRSVLTSVVLDSPLKKMLNPIGFIFESEAPQFTDGIVTHFSV